MRGFPKHLNTKQDYLNVLGEYPDETKAALQRLSDGRIQWLNVDELAPEDQGIEDDTHKVIESDIDGTVLRHQYEYKENPNAALFRLGFNVEDIEDLIDE